jgi:Tol biopolymer transport system component
MAAFYAEIDPADAFWQEDILPIEKWPDSEELRPLAGETNFRTVRKLTFGGQNAEAYFSTDGKNIVWQTKQENFPDEQIFTMTADGKNRRLVSTGLGRTTCSYFSPDKKWIYFSSTHTKNQGAQRRLDMSKGYVWMVNPEFSLYRVPARGGKPEQILDKNQYVAETTISPDGKHMYFTGGWEGDLHIYRSRLDGKNLERLTDLPGYNGGPFISWDSKKVVYRRSPLWKTEEERTEWYNLFREHLVRPSRMDLWIMDSNGKNSRQVTNIPGANFAPFLHPDGKRIIFSSNHHDPRGRQFELFIVNTDGTGLKRVTYGNEFDSFPMFSRDGKYLIWSSNRAGKVARETNVFVAEWKD